jgi:tetratricopeptide (TPR) repeat protein
VVIVIPGRAQSTEEGVDYLSVAGRLLHDGSYQRAEQTLEKVPDNQRNSEKYRTIRGLLALYQERFSEAETYFRQNLKQGSENRYLYIYLGQALYGQKNYEQALTAFAEVEPLATSIPSVYLIRSKSLWQLDRQQAAWDMVHTGLAQFGDEFRLHRLKMQWLAQLKLYRNLADYAWSLLDKPAISDQDLLTAASLLHQGEAYQEAIELLESLHLRNPFKPGFALRLAYAYLQSDRRLTAAQIFEDVARTTPQYAYEAAELFRQEQHWSRALSLNARVIDQPKKFKQKLAILLAKGDFELAAGLESDLERLGLLQTEDLRYALAYALFKTGRFTEANQHLARIQRPDLFKKAVALRKEMAQCQTGDQGISCV